MIHARGNMGAILDVAHCEMIDLERTDSLLSYAEEELTDNRENITCHDCIKVLGGNVLFFNQRLRWRGVPDTTKRVL